MNISAGQKKAFFVSDDSVIAAEDLTKKFGDNVVLDNICLNIEKGKTTVVIGPSGCGKTVLIKHFIVLLRPTSGRVYFKQARIDNLNENQLSKLRVHYGFLFQGGALFDSLSVAENIMFPIMQHYRITDYARVEEIVRVKLMIVGMDGFQHYYPANLSGGQRKRVALARAIAMNPEVILYDEPTTGLDPIRADIINELIIKLQKELGLTSIVVTHDMASAYKVADRIVMLHEGRIIADGDAEHIRSHPHEVVQQFINGRLNEQDLAVLRTSEALTRNQLLPEERQQ
ncbi:MAG TPA: ABC transporter ATP-binding protein [Sedimentisphaerales bacterium]|nr:ABC transporter ATP-binding protein [Sedimentisphaerales bacterium]